VNDKDRSVLEQFLTVMPDKEN